MAATIIDGNQIARVIRQEVASGVAALRIECNVIPGIAAFLVGDDPASAIYVRNKGRACEEVGILAETYRFPSDISETELLEQVGYANADDRFHGVLLQLPLPPHVGEDVVISAIDPRKDVDGLHPLNLGKLVDGERGFIPGTPAGIQEMLKRSGYNVEGKNMVICGRSNIVGKPAALLFMQKNEWANATVTVCHTSTKNMADITRSADILIVAMGKAGAITADMVKEGVVVIDVGMNRVPDSSRRQGYRLVGDVDFENVSAKASAITPVPGGVGPMTVAMLLVNTLRAAMDREGLL